MLSGKILVEKVIETDNVLAYKHTRPYWPVHIVVIPKTHIESLLTIDDPELLLEIMNVVRRVADSVVREFVVCRVVTNLGRYQESKHLLVQGNRSDKKYKRSLSNLQRDFNQISVFQPVSFFNFLCGLFCHGLIWCMNEVCDVNVAILN